MKVNSLVVVITINYNQSNMSIDCVDSIVKSKYANFEVIIIDNGSTKEQFDLLKANIHSNVNVERIEVNCGYVGGVNHGLLKASELNPDYYLIMNNDTIIDENAIDALVTTAKKYDQQAIVSGKVYHFDRPDTLQYVGGILQDERYLKMNNIHIDEKDIGQCDNESERDMLDDIFWLLPSKIYSVMGRYSDNFFLYAEQADYARRAVNIGYKLVYTPKAKIWHKGSLTTGGGNRVSPAVNFWRKKSSVIYKYRNLKARYFVIYLFKLLYKQLFKNLLNATSLRNSSNKKSEYAALKGILYGIKWVLNKKPDNGYNPFL